MTSENPSTCTRAPAMNRFHPSSLLVLGLLAMVAQGCGSSPASKAQTSPPAAGSGAAAQLSLAVDAQPPAGLPGEPLAFAVSFRDASGQVSAGATDLVTVALAANPRQAVLAGTTTRPAVNGVATFDDLVIPKPGQGYTLVATAADAGTATSAAFDVAFSTSEREQPGSGANDAPAGAEAILPGVPMFGSLSSADDVDVYRFEARAGQLLSVSASATRLDLAGWDGAPVIRLLGSDGAELQRMGSTETGLLAMDDGLSRVRIPQDGRYHVSCEADPSALVTGQYALLVKLDEAPGGEVAEVEPPGATGQDDDLAHAQPLAPGLLHGFYQAPGTTGNDSDVYRIAITAPTRVRVQLVASRNGAADHAPALATAWDAVLDLEDASGTVLWENDDTWLLDPSIDYLVATPGDYLVRVRRFGADQGSSPYLLSYQALPYAPSPAAPDSTVSYGQYASTTFGSARETQTFAFSGSKGDLVRVWIQDRTHLQASPVTVDPSLPGTLFLDASQNPLPTGVSPFASLPPGDSNLNVMQTILAADGTHFVRFTNGTATGTFGFLVEKVAAAAYEAEPNDAPASASAVSEGGWGAGAIGTPGDADAWAVHAEEGQLVSAAVLGGPVSDLGPFSDWGSALVPALRVLDGQGHVLATASASRPGAGNFARSVLRPDATLEVAFRAPAAGDYFVVVTDAGGGGGPSVLYALQILKNR